MAERLSPAEIRRRNEIVSALKEHGVTLPCPRCGKEQFSIGGESDVPITKLPGVIFTSGYTIPVVFVICDDCGFIAQHAKKVLEIPER
jgi:predicted RNA-binding Zn-ribbon protein involved in translation (DUF1610 family)